MGVLYRGATADDAGAATKIFAEAVNHLNETHGFSDRPIKPHPPSPFIAFSFQEQPKWCWVADDGGEIVAFAISWVYGSFWFLSYLFVLPTYHGMGIGRELLRRALTHGSAATITNRGLITFAYNPVSIALYATCGMCPRESVYWMLGRSKDVRASLRQPRSEGYVPERIGAGQDALSSLTRIDESVLGFARERHHQYLLRATGASCYLFRDGGTVNGYAYVWSSGRIGPLAATEASKFEAIMKSALTMAATGTTEEVFTVIPGPNERAMSLALQHGLRITYPMLLMSEEPFGNWEVYLFHSAALM